jgi:hypothetical protein
LITKSTFPPIGTAEVVANPNGGGLGVPMSVWLNLNEACPASPAADLEQGNWSTCELNEWYETDELPAGMACTTGSCSCSVRESLSNTHGSELVFGIDLVADDDFPCDLFAFFFGVPRIDYEAIKSLATVITDCSILDENSFGIYWAEGSGCLINANTVIGSAHAPVLLISAASETRFNGTATVYGVMYLTDVEDATAYLDVVGDMTTYGAVIVDSTLDFNGTFRVVYNESAVRNAAGQGAIGSLSPGWTDFPANWQ